MLSKETIERIKKDAEIYSPIITIEYDNHGTLSSRDDNKPERESYIAGATAEATRYEQERKELREALEVANKENDRLKQVAKNAFYTFRMQPFPHNNPTYVEFCKDNNL